MSNTLPAAIFDWDGVIVDSSRAHEEGWEELARETGRTLPSGHFKRGFGMKNEEIIPHLLRWTDEAREIQRLSLRKEELFRKIVTRRGITALPGVEPFLAMLRLARVPCVIASSSHRLNITCALEMLGLRDRFLGIISSEDVHLGKPDPEVFLLAARRMEREPRECVVFEDAPVGIAAGKAAGMKVVAVAGTHPEMALQQAAHIVRRLDELKIEDLRRVMATMDVPHSHVRAGIAGRRAAAVEEEILRMNFKKTVEKAC